MMPQSFALPKGKKVMLLDGKQVEVYMDNWIYSRTWESLSSSVVNSSNGGAKISRIDYRSVAM